MAKTTRHRAAGAAWLRAAACAFAAASLCAQDARAQCVQTGSNVVCTGTDADGFAAGAGVSDLTVTVQPGASVQDSATDTAISLNLRNTIAIEGTGSVSATGSGAQAIEGNGQNRLTNRGSVLVVGGDATGVALGASSTVTNEATGRVVLNTSGLLQGNNLGVAADLNGTVVNHGLIEVRGLNATGARTASNGRVTNTGRIRTPDSLGTGVALDSRVSASGSPTGMLSTLDNSGSIEATGDGGVGVRIDGARATVTNRGTITGGSGTGVGVLFDRPTSEPNLQRNLFTNEAGGVVSASSGVAIRGGADQDVVLNSGSLVGRTELGGGDDILGWRPGATSTAPIDGEAGRDTVQIVQETPGGSVDGAFDLGTVTNFEELVVGATGDVGTWTISGSGTFANGVTVRAPAVFSAGASVAGSIDVQAASARLGDATSFQGVTLTGGELVFESGANVQAPSVAANGGTLSADGISSLASDLSLGAGSTYQASYDAASSSRLDVAGDVVIQPGATLSLVQTDTSAGTRSFRILSATQGLTGVFGAFGGSAFQSVSATYGPGAGASFVDVSVTSSFAVPATSPNENRVGQHLDAARAIGGSPDLTSVLASLLAITDPSTAANALDALHPELYDAHTSASLATGNTYTRMLARRPLRCEQLVSPYRRDRPSLAPCGERRFTPWVQGFGRAVDRDAASNYTDWHTWGGGLAVGVERDLGRDLLVSAMLGTSRTALDFDTRGDASLSTFETGLGVGWRRGGTYVRGAVEYGHAWHETRRRIEFPGLSRLARSDYESDRASALVELGHVFLLGPFEIEPLASVDYTYLHEESFDESDAGAVGLEVDRRENALVGTNAGFRAGMTLVKWYYAGELLEWADGVWRPEVAASWRQVWNDYDRALSSSLEGAPGAPEFRTRTEDAEVGADLAARVIFQPYGTRNTVELGYEAFVGDGSISHALMARLRIPL